MKTAHALISVLNAHPSQAALDSIVTLRSYSAGKADKYAALRALSCLERIYGPPVKDAVIFYRRCLGIQDKAVQSEMLFQALTLLIDWVFRRQIRASLWEIVIRTSGMLRNAILDRVSRSRNSPALSMNFSDLYPV